MPAKPFVGLGVGWTTDTIKCALLKSSHTPSTTHVYWSDVSTDEVAGTGYTAGGLTLTSPTWGLTSGTVYMNAENAVWDPVTFTSAAYMYVWKDTGTASNSPLVGYYDCRDNGTGRSVTTGRAEFQIGASGYVQAKVYGEGS